MTDLAASKALAIRDMATMPALTAGSVDAYITVANQIPVLSPDEERQLAEQVFHHNDVVAAQRMILSHLRFVIHVARGYAGYGLALGDLIQEGNIGLMKDVKRFDPAHGVRLVSFAVHWIRAEIHEFVLRNWRIVKVATTKAQRKLFFNLRSSKKRLGWLNRQEVERVAGDLGVKPEEVLEMESRLSGHDIAFDLTPDEDEGEAYRTPAAHLQDMRYEPARAIEAEDSETRNAQLLRAGLKQLDERSRDILHRRWMGDDKATLHELADQYGVSAERIRQIEANAIKKLRSVFTA